MNGLQVDVFDLITHGSMRLSHDLKIEEVSGKFHEVFGYVPEEIAGKSLDALLVDSPLMYQGSISNALLSTTEPVMLKRSILASNGNKKEAKLIFKHLDDDNYLLTIQSLDPMDLFEEDLFDNSFQRFIAKLSGSIAHQMNNYLASILGYCDIIIDRTMHCDLDLEEEYQTVRSAIEQSILITKQLLAYSHQGYAQISPIPVIQAFDELMPFLTHLKMLNIELVLDDLDRKHVVMFDPLLLQQIFLTMLTNARDAMPDGGKIIVATLEVKLEEAYTVSNMTIPPGDYIQITMEDEGTGIDDDIIQSIYKPFFTTKGVSGNGLGLSATYSILKEFGGLIEVKTSKGSGSTFHVYIPVGSKKEVVIEEETGDLPHDITILVAEDDPLLRVMLTKILEREGYKVFAAEHGRAALEIALTLKSKIDLLVTDIVMPVMGAKELIVQINKLYPHLKALFISGYSEDPIIDLLQKRNSRFLQKPFDNSLFIKTVQSMIRAK